MPPKGKTCDSACMDRSVSIMRNRIDKLGVSEPEIRKQGTDQIVIQLAGVHDANKAAQIIGKTAQLEFYDLEADLDRALERRRPARGRQRRASTTCSRQVQADAKKGTPIAYYLFNAKKKLGRGARGHARAAAERDAAKRPQVERRRSRKASRCWRCRPSTIVVSCDQATTGCPGVQQVDATAPTVYYLFKYDPDNPTNPVPEMTGDDLKLSGHARRHQHAGPGHVVRLGFTGKGAEEVPRHHAQGGATRRGGRSGRRPDRQRRRDDPAVRAALRDRARRRDQVVAVDRLQAEPGRDRPDGNGRRDLEHRAASARRRTSRSCSRPVRCRSSSSRSSAPTSRRRSARTRSRRRRRAALIGLLVVALFLLVFYRFLGVVAVDRPRHLRGLPVRGDPALQRHADAAGLRRPDPHDRRRGRRERRHLRTHQGRGARREVRARRDRGRLREGLPHDHRRERRHRDHGARALRRRDRAGQGLRADAADRHRDLADHRGRRDARDARPARRLPLVRQPALHGRERPADRRSGCRSTSCAAATSGSRSPARSS